MNPVCSYKINYPSDLYTVQCTITWISSSVKLNTIHMCVLLFCILHCTYVCSCAGFYTAHLCALVLIFILHMCMLLCRIYTTHVSALVLYFTLHTCVLLCRIYTTHMCALVPDFTLHMCSYVGLYTCVYVFALERISMFHFQVCKVFLSFASDGFAHFCRNFSTCNFKVLNFFYCYILPLLYFGLQTHSLILWCI